MTLLADLAAELLDRGITEFTERVEVSNLLVVLESGRSTLLDSKDACIHHNHVFADKRVDVVKGACLIILLSIGRVALVVFAEAHQASWRRRDWHQDWRHGPEYCESLPLSSGSLPSSMVVGRSVDFGQILVDLSQIVRDSVVAGQLQSAVASYWV